jgi:transmembrane sensor
MNELTPEALRELADKYLKGTITEAEKKQLDQWYNSQTPSFVEWEPDRNEDELKERLYNSIAGDLYRKVGIRGINSATGRPS